MPQPRHLRSAPITEALVDVRIKLPPAVDLPALEKLHHEVARDYPKKDTMKFAQMHLSLGETASGKLHQNDLGYRFTSATGQHIVQFRLSADLAGGVARGGVQCPDSFSRDV